MFSLVQFVSEYIVREYKNICPFGTVRFSIIFAYSCGQHYYLHEVPEERVFAKPIHLFRILPSG